MVKLTPVPLHTVASLHTPVPLHTQASLPAVAPLPHLGAWTLAGRGARSFLQGYVTSELGDTQPDAWRATAFCTIKGRTLATALVCGNSEQITFIMLREMIDPVLDSLQKYLAFARGCTLHRNASHIFGCMGQFAADAGAARLSFCTDQPLAIRLSTSDEAEADWRALCELATPADARLWAWHEVLNGFVHVTPPIREAFLPQVIGLDVLSGVSYTKGCYLGQEIIVRAAHRGKVKRRLVAIEWRDETHTDIHVGDRLVNAQGRDAGVLVAFAASPMHLHRSQRESREQPASASLYRGLAVVGGEPEQELHLANRAVTLLGEPVAPAP